MLRSLPMSLQLIKLPSEFLYVQLTSHHQEAIPRNHAGLVKHDLIYINKNFFLILSSQIMVFQ